jgi:pilus assembly protein CpaB
MSPRTIASFAVAIFLGLIAVMLVRTYISGRNSTPTATAPGMTPVVVANAAVARGMPLKRDVLKVVNFPNDSVPPDSYRKLDDLAPANAPPKIVMREIVANEPIVAAKISATGTANLSAQLEPGMRAVSLRSSDVAGVGGFVLPGDRVDVLLTRVPGEKNDKSHTIVQILADNVRVMGVDQSADADKPTVARAITVEVTPEQAQKISLAQAIGDVSFALRQANDQVPLSKRLTTAAELGGVPAPQRARRAVPANIVRVTRGTEIAGYAVPR